VNNPLSFPEETKLSFQDGSGVISAVGEEEDVERVESVFRLVVALKLTRLQLNRSDISFTSNVGAV
jgi:hypothetical protein